MIAQAQSAGALALVLALALGSAGCATNAPSQASPSGAPSLSDRQYQKLIKKHTRKSDQYSGFYQTFQADATLLASELRAAIAQRRSEFLQLDATEALKERDKAFQELAASTKVFLRFYSPESDYDDLNQAKSIWKIYLTSGGQRYEGSVKKMTEKSAEIKNLFNHFNRFSTPYEISFPVPTAQVEAAGGEVTLTSSLGTAVFKFEAGQ